MKARLFFLIFIVFLSIPAILPLFHPGFFQSDDGEWMIIRLSAFHEAFRDGQIPVRFLSRLNHGYGYPVANFLYPGFMYLAEPIHLLGFGFVNTIKIVFGMSMIASAIFCFLWLLRFFGKLPSFIGALFYLYTPYHLFDFYKRGSIGEVLALTVLPFILWQIERKSLFLSSIGITALILSHNTLAVLFLGLIVLYMSLDVYISKDRRVLLQKYFLTLIFGLGMSSFFWIPAFLELRYTVFSQTQVSEWSNYFSSFSLIGLSTFLVLLLTAFTIPQFRHSGKRSASRISMVQRDSGLARMTARDMYFALFFITGLLSIFFATALSSPLWKILPVSFVQFPFRFLSITILSTAFLSAFMVNQVKNSNKRLPVALILLVVLWFSAVPFMKPSEFFDKGEGFYATNMDTTTVKNEYMPIWVKEKPLARFKEKVEIVGGVGIVENILYNSKKITFDVLARENVKVRINTIYYPGWKAYVDKKSTNISYANEKGIMEINVPSGRHLVEAGFGETPVRLASDIISIASFFSILAISAASYKRRLFRL